MSGKFLDKFQIYSIKMKLTWSLHKLDLLKKLHCFVKIYYFTFCIRLSVMKSKNVLLYRIG